MGIIKNEVGGVNKQYAKVHKIALDKVQMAATFASQASSSVKRAPTSGEQTP